MPIKTLNFKQSLLIGAFIYVSAALLTACQRGIVANPKEENIAETIIHSDKAEGSATSTTTQQPDATNKPGSGLKKVAPAQPNQICDQKMKKEDIQIMEENFKVLSTDFKIQLKTSMTQDLTDLSQNNTQAKKAQKVIVDVFGIKTKDSVLALGEQVENIQLMIKKYKKSETNAACFTEVEEAYYPAILNGLQRFLTLDPEVQKDCNDEKIQADLNFIAAAQKALAQKGILLDLGVLAKQKKQSVDVQEVHAKSDDVNAKEKNQDQSYPNHTMEIEILKQLEARLQSLEKVPSSPALNFENGVSAACILPVAKLKNSQELSLKDTVLVFDEAHINKNVLDTDISRVRLSLQLLEIADDGAVTKAVERSDDGITQEELPPLKEEVPSTPVKEEPAKETPSNVGNDKSLVPTTPVAPVAPLAPVIPAAPAVKAIPEYQRKGERMGVNTNIQEKPSIPNQKPSAVQKKNGSNKNNTSGSSKKSRTDKKTSKVKPAVAAPAVKPAAAAPAAKPAVAVPVKVIKQIKEPSLD